MTIVELVIAITVLVLISTLFFSKQDTSKYSISHFTKQLCSDIRYIRKCNMLGDFDTYIYTKEDEDIISYMVRSNGEDIKTIEMPSNIKVKNMDRIIKFKKDGSPNPSGRTILVYNESYKKEITIVPVSGRVLLKEGKYES